MMSTVRLLDTLVDFTLQFNNVLYFAIFSVSTLKPDSKAGVS